MKDFANKLKKILKKRNISQSDLARGVKLSRSSISHYVNGNVEPTHNNVVAIARYLKVPVSYFIDNYNDDSLNYEIINEINIKGLKEYKTKLNEVLEIITNLEENIEQLNKIKLEIEI